ncbi:MAG: ROK family transcriptional regulator [Spirochaetales bacterium]|nr:ROK family transcriptional regulator [Spirochaetales bacterium]
MKTGDNDLIKKINFGIILDTIREAGAISRIEISRRTGLSRSTCSAICESMLSQNLITETGKSISSGGRKPILLELNIHAGIVIGLKLMEGEIIGAVVNLGGEVLLKKQTQVPRRLEPEIYIEDLKQFIHELINTSQTVLMTNHVDPMNVLGIGVGMSGRIDSTNGILLESSILEWKYIQIGNILEEHFGIPVYLENDVNTFAIGEKFFGIGKPYSNYLCITIGEGIGLGIVLQGNLYRGHHHGAGEFGHIKIAYGEDAPVCSCGKKGCLEAFASDNAIVGYVHKKDGRDPSIIEVTESAEKGDPVCLEAFALAGRYLGAGISTLINLFDPEALIIGGERAGAAHLFMDGMKEVIAENTVYELAKDIDIHVLKPDTDHWVRGVATLAIKEFFSKPGV